MAFTGDLEHLPIADIIQLVNTTRKSGIFSVKGDKGESRIVFSNGYIVGANHLNSTVRIGTVLVKSGAITVEDLKEALTAGNGDPQDRRPLLMTTLMQAGKLKREDAMGGLKKLVSMTIVELMNWTKGTFTFDTEAPVVTEDDGDELVVDAQMVLMDAMRIFDERERDRATGKEVPAFEALYADVLPDIHPEVRAAEAAGESSAITADILGLGDLDQLEKKIPRPVSEMELFDPVEIHRQKIWELLPGFSSQEQEPLVSFLRGYVTRKAAPEAAAQQAGKALALFSTDKLLRHMIMTIGKVEGLPVFTADDDAELERILAQCLSAARMPVVVFDGPGTTDNGIPPEAVANLRNRVREKHPAVPVFQLAAPREIDFILQSYDDNVRAVFPKPSKDGPKDAYIRDTIRFLGSLTSHLKGLQLRTDTTERYVKELKKDIKALREIATPSDAALVMLISVADMFERAVTFIARPGELAGERAIGVSSDKSLGPTPADRLKIPLAKPSVFREVLERGLAYYGETRDEAVQELFQEIGKPVSPAVVLLPLISERKVVAVVYGDFGKKPASPVQLDILEILAQQVGISLEYAIFRRQAAKAPQKP